MIAWVARGVAQLVRVHVPEAGLTPDAGDDTGDAIAVQRPTVGVSQEPAACRWMQVGPVGEETGGVGVHGHVAVVVELADRDPQPRGVVQHDDRVGGEGAELTDAHPGPRQQLDDEPIERWCERGARREPGGLGVVEETWERVIGDGDIDREDRCPCWGVGPVPLDDAIEERAERPEPLADRVARREPASGGCPGGEEQFEPFDMGAAHVSEPGDIRVGVDEPSGEATQGVVGHVDRRWAQGDSDLVEIAPPGQRQLRGSGDDTFPVPMPHNAVIEAGLERGHARPLVVVSIRSAAR